MVVLTIAAPSNPHTVYFDQPLRKPSYIRLISCSLYNSWFNLKNVGVVSFKTSGNTTFHSQTIIPGHYSYRTVIYKKLKI